MQHLGPEASKAACAQAHTVVRFTGGQPGLLEEPLLHAHPQTNHADPSKRPQSTRLAAALFGMINAVVTLPVLIAYTAIVFQASKGFSVV